MKGKIESFFKLKEHNTNIQTEVIAGITTFVTIAYILVVNPSILSAGGMDSGAVFTATAVTSALGTLLMALSTNYPFIITPGMGLNAFMIYTVVLSMGYSWQVALAAFFVEGFIFLIISLTKIRELVLDAIPHSLKLAITAGIGLFITFIGLKSAGIVVDSPSTLVTIFPFHGSMEAGTFSTGGVSAILGLLGIVITALLMIYNVKGNILLGILITWGLGLICQLAGIYVPDPAAGYGSLIPDFSRGLAIPSMAPTFLKMDFSQVFSVGFATIVIAYLFTNISETFGALVGSATKVGVLDDNGKFPRFKNALVSQSVSCMTAAAAGTSATTAVVECAAGIAAGGRTGLTSLVTAIMFGVALFLLPIFLAIPSFATAPALVIVGFLMISSLLSIDFSDMSEAMPAFICLFTIPFTYSIVEGMATGFISYVIINALGGKERRKKVSIAMYVIALLFIVKYFFV